MTKQSSWHIEKHKLKRLKQLIRAKTKKMVDALGFTRGDITALNPFAFEKNRLLRVSTGSIARLLGCTARVWEQRVKWVADLSNDIWPTAEPKEPPDVNFVLLSAKYRANWKEEDLLLATNAQQLQETSRLSLRQKVARLNSLHEV